MRLWGSVLARRPFREPGHQRPALGHSGRAHRRRGRRPASAWAYRAYAEGSGLIALIGSTGYLEIALPGGSAQDATGWVLARRLA